MKMEKNNNLDFEEIVDVLSRNLSIRVIKYYTICNQQFEYSFSYNNAPKATQQKFKKIFVEHLRRKLEVLNKRIPLIYTTNTLPSNNRLKTSNINMLEVFDCLPSLSKWEAYIFPFDTTITIELINRYEDNSYFNCYISDWILNNY